MLSPVFSTYKVVSFDVGDTLIELRKDLIPNFVAECVGELDERFKDQEKQRQVAQEFNDMLEKDPKVRGLLRVAHDKPKLFAEQDRLSLFMKTWAEKTGFPSEKLKPLMGMVYLKASAQNSPFMRKFSDSEPLLKKLKERGLKLMVVSNWGPELRSVLQCHGLEPYFDVIIASGDSDVQCEKPNSKIFEIALRKLNQVCNTNFVAKDVLHIGDQIEADSLGAKNAGMDSLLLIRNPGSGENDGYVTIMSLNEVSKHL